MIYLAGDIHGELEVDKVVDYFEREIQLRKSEGKEPLTEEDSLIILGDVGLCWYGGERDERVRKILETLPVTTLWIDGNHENFDLIDALPETDWNGGRVQYIGDKIIHLMRGYIYEIEGMRFFAFGGGYSIDKIYRREGLSWWRREMPSDEEYERGRRSLEEVNYRVDYIITHTIPASVASRLVPVVYSGEEELQDYFQEIAENAEYKKWYFGHWHMDVRMDDYIGLYDEVVRLGE